MEDVRDQDAHECITKTGGEVQSDSTHIDANSIRRLSLPRAVYDFHLDKAPHIRIKLVHEKVDVKEVVELPAFFYQWIAKEIR